MLSPGDYTGDKVYTSAVPTVINEVLTPAVSTSDEILTSAVSTSDEVLTSGFYFGDKVLTYNVYTNGEIQHLVLLLVMKSVHQSSNVDEHTLTFFCLS